jgi:hypothetical protein
MILTLNVYDELGEVLKTYERNSYALRMRQLKDIIETLNLDKLAKCFTSTDAKGNTEMIQLISDMVMNSWDKVEELMLDIFPEMTKEEYLDTSVNEVVQVIINLGKYAFTTIGLAGSGQKN